MSEKGCEKHSLIHCTRCAEDAVKQRLRERVAELEATIADQRRTIEALMAGSPDDTTTPTIARIGRLEADVEKYRKDAERYRKARSLVNLLKMAWQFTGDDATEEQLDAAIDAALAAKGE